MSRDDAYRLEQEDGYMGDIGSESYSGMKKVTREIRPGQVLLMLMSFAMAVIGFLMTMWILYNELFHGRDSTLVFVAFAIMLWAGGGLLGPLLLRKILKPTGKGWIGTLFLGLHIPVYLFALFELLQMVVAFGDSGGPPVAW
jgi:hypothetical protein